MKKNFKPKFLIVLLALVMATALIPMRILSVFAVGDGLTEETAMEVTDYATFKTAMENPDVGYVKISNNFSSVITSQTGNMVVGATVSSPKVLIVNGEATFTANAIAGSDIVDSLIQTTSNANLTIKGTGTLQFKANGSTSTNAVIRLDGGTVNIQGSLTIHGTYNTATYGCAVFINNGNCVI